MTEMCSYEAHWNLEFEARWSQRYHKKWVTILGRRRNGISFLALFVGSGAILAILQEAPKISLWAMGVVAAFNLFAVVFRIDDDYFHHRLALSKLTGFLDRLPRSEGLKPRKIGTLKKDLRKCYIEVHERNTTIEASAFNDICLSKGLSKQHWRYIYPHKRFFFPSILPLPPREIPKWNDVSNLAIVGSYGLVVLVIGVALFTVYVLLPESGP